MFNFWGYWLRKLILCKLTILFALIPTNNSVMEEAVIYKLHTVQRGETLTSIASLYGITVDRLRNANSWAIFPENMPLSEGKVLVVPIPAQGAAAGDGNTYANSLTKVNAFWIYEAKDGETLETIANNFKIPIKILCEANRHISPEIKLRAGITILVPIIVDDQVAGEVGRKDALTKQSKASSVSGNMAKSSSIDAAANSSLAQNAYKHPSFRSSRENAKDFATIGVAKVKSPIYSAPNVNSPRYYTCQAGRKLVIVGRKNGWFGVLMVNGAVGWIRERMVALTGERIALPVAQQLNNTRMIAYNSLGYSIVKEAMRYLGVPYKYGGTSMNGIDCSALVQKVYEAFGIRLPRTATEQLRYGIPVDFTQLQPGDRVYFSNDGVRSNHCGIYIGGDKFIHASGRHGRVTISSLYESRYFNTFLCALR